MAAKVVSVLNNINPAFYSLWQSRAGHILAKGGRSSTKSSVISQKLVHKHLRAPQSNAVILRRYGATLEKSVYAQMRWALEKAGVLGQYTCTVYPMRILHRKTGTGFYFAGGDDAEKLKSLKIATGYVSDVWFEEMDSFAGEEDIDKIEDTFIRQRGPGGETVTVWGSWNPPRNPFHWINGYVERHAGDGDYFIHHSTYLDDVLGFNSPQMLEKIDKYRKTAPEYYRWMYLGEVVGFTGAVYNMAQFGVLACPNHLNEGPLAALYYAMDTGHQTSATACLCLGLTPKGSVVLLNTWYYSPAGQAVKKAPSQLAASVHAFVARTSRRHGAPIARRTIDSAEGALRNQYFLDYGVRWHPVKKLAKADMIDRVHDLLAQGRFYYVQNEENQIFVKEHQRYDWSEDEADAGAQALSSNRASSSRQVGFFMRTPLHHLYPVPYTSPQ